MKEYIVTLISKDKQKYQVQLGAPSDKDAEVYALEKIHQKGWDVYDYVLHQLERIK